jgi:hypothetical protein
MRLTLSLYGPFRAWLDDTELVVSSRRGRAILAMLALSGTGAVARDRLAATLWPDRSEEQARASLRQELSSLRRALGNGAGIVTADATSVRIDASALSPDRGRPEDGEFLEGLDLRSEPFDDWRREQAALLSEAGDPGRRACRTSSPTPPSLFSASTRLRTAPTTSPSPRGW